MSSSKKDNCVCDALEAILDAQDAVQDDCPTSCFANLLNPTVLPGRDTIPFILYTKKGKPFSAFGGIVPANNNFLPGRAVANGFQPFQTPFFRVKDLKGCCATLELLMPDEIVCPAEEGIGDVICNTTQLMRTGHCIEVDADCFCAIQCLSPDLVVPFFVDNEGAHD